MCLITIQKGTRSASEIQIASLIVGRLVNYFFIYILRFSLAKSSPPCLSFSIYFFAFYYDKRETKAAILKELSRDFVRVCFVIDLKNLA